MALFRPRSLVPTREPGEARVLLPDDVASLRLGWHHRHNDVDVYQLLERSPGRSAWMPTNGDFALGTVWRHRAEIVAVAELSGTRSASALLDVLCGQAADHGAKLVVILEMDERRRPSFYERVGFERLEEVVTYELDAPRADSLASAPLVFTRVRPTDDALIATITALDNAAFPWLWWNCDAEFRGYVHMPGVDVFVGFLGDQPVSYVGLTTYDGWGHLDRIAVAPGHQGQGLGQRTLTYATAHLARRGAAKIGLSTQGQNMHSRRLYERFGFTRSRDSDYRIYGRWLRDSQGSRPGRGVITHLGNLAGDIEDRR